MESSKDCGLQQQNKHTNNNQKDAFDNRNRNNYIYIYPLDFSLPIFLAHLGRISPKKNPNPSPFRLPVWPLSTAEGSTSGTVLVGACRNFWNQGWNKNNTNENNWPAKRLIHTHQILLRFYGEAPSFQSESKLELPKEILFLLRDTVDGRNLANHLGCVWNPVNKWDFNYQPPSTGELIPDFWLSSTVVPYLCFILSCKASSFFEPTENLPVDLLPRFCFGVANGLRLGVSNIPD